MTMHKALIVAAFAGALFAASVAVSTPPASANMVNWDAVAQCESSGNWSTNTGNGFYGGLQFLPSTWNENGGVGFPHRASREEQIRVADRVLRTQGIGAWPVCGALADSPTFSSSVPPGTGIACRTMSGSVLGIVDLNRLCGALVARTRILSTVLGVG
ncbi:MAG: Transglycosylase domain protein [Mycobacterium sp.]|nr:Transglycosylase domain protein [Mycobacterium sp.]